MEIRDFLLWAHMATGASPAMARRVLTGLGHQMPVELSTIVHCTPEKQRAQVTAWLDDARNQAHMARLIATPHLVYTDDDYPARLQEISQPPLVLFYAGKLDLLRRPCLGVVGARLATEYSNQAIVQAISQVPRDTVIVSGLARGADTMAHSVAIGSRRSTVAVIASGLDVYYPLEHQDLQDEIAATGLLVSEYPPGTKPKPYRFVARNRIIAGLSHAVFVTEAAEKSGSLITAKMALETGRDVYALPNRMHNPLGIGTNKMIADGAIPVLPDTNWTNIHYFD
jgi:DNA processing protein